MGIGQAIGSEGLRHGIPTCGNAGPADVWLFRHFIILLGVHLNNHALPI